MNYTNLDKVFRGISFYGYSFLDSLRNLTIDSITLTFISRENNSFIRIELNNFHIPNMNSREIIKTVENMIWTSIKGFLVHENQLFYAQKLILDYE